MKRNKKQHMVNRMWAIVLSMIIGGNLLMLSSPPALAESEIQEDADSEKEDTTGDDATEDDTVEDDLLAFENDTVSYVLGTAETMADQKAVKKHEDDNGEVSYAAETLDRLGTLEEIGVVCDGATGELTVTDYVRLSRALTAKQNELVIQITATKTAGTEKTIGQTDAHIIYEACQRNYEVIVSYERMPEKTYLLKDPQGEVLDGPNGTNGWFNTAVTVVPEEGGSYMIARDEPVDFSSQVVFDDQGEAERIIYLRNVKTKGITAPLVIHVEKIDSVCPDSNALTITYSEPVLSGRFSFYDGPVTITFTAYDVTSGVDSFTWNYTRAEDASKTNLDTVNGVVEAVCDQEDATKFTGQITLSGDQAEQMRGHITVRATDKANQSSEKKEEERILVVDTISPTREISFELAEAGGKAQEIDDHFYFSDDVLFTFRITEANFFGEDVAVKVSKNNGAAVPVNVTWSNSGEIDGQEATYRLSGDGDYVVSVEYKDRSGHVMETYQSALVTIDTIKPLLRAAYIEPDRTVGTRMYYNKNVRAAFEITETNFHPEEVVAEAARNDGVFVEVPLDWKETQAGTHVGTCTLVAREDHAADGEYVFRVIYTDRSGNEMSVYTSNTIIIDTTAPVIQVSYSNHNVVNTLEDAHGHRREYFADAQIATVHVEEHNFEPAEVDFTMLAEDVSGNDINRDAVSVFSSWETTGDMHVLTINYTGDANYSFGIGYKDLAANAADDYGADYFTVDTTAPENLQVSYSTSILDAVLEHVSFGFYKAPMTVTLSAEDTVSGVHGFQYKDTNAEPINRRIEEADITYAGDHTMGTAVVRIPDEALERKGQFNGTLSFSAEDRSGNGSAPREETKRIVVDTISPTAKVEYSAPVASSDGIAYYDGAIHGTITINETNFYAEDVQISVTNGGEAYNVAPAWSDVNAEVHEGSFILGADGDYVVTIHYTDKSANQMETYTSAQMTVDTGIEAPLITVNGGEADGGAFKGPVIPAVSFADDNFEGYELSLTRTRYGDKNTDVTEELIGDHMSIYAQGGSGSFDTFSREQDVDGIYTMTVSITDKAGHAAETKAVFTVNRFGSVYEYSDYLSSLIADGGAYVREVKNDLVITEYNADRLVEDSVNIAISRDGKPIETIVYHAAPQADDQAGAESSGWYRYQYTISKDNFAADGTYKVAVSSEDAAGNAPEITNYEDKNILFRVDRTPPEINSITGLEHQIINAQEVTVKYTVYDTVGLVSVQVYVNGENVDTITDFSKDRNHYEGNFVVKEKNAQQNVRLVVEDQAGNRTDTDGENFKSTFAFQKAVTVSTSFFVRVYADRLLFWGIAVGAAAMAGVGSVVALIQYKRQKQNKKNR